MKENNFNEELLENLQKEIKELEKEIKINNNIEKKILEKLLITLRLVAPYALATTFTVGLFDVLGVGIPFIKDEIKCRLQKEIEIDTLGNTKIYETYNEIEKYNITFTYADKFKLNDDGSYYRNITIYDAKKIDQEILIDIINNKKTNIDGLFKKILDQKIEVRNNVTEEEINEEFYMSYSYYDINKNEYIYKEYSLKENLLFAILELFMIVPEYIIITFFRNVNYNYKLKLDKIDDKYYLKQEHLKKLIRIKKDNYNILAGNDNE